MRWQVREQWSVLHYMVGLVGIKYHVSAQQDSEAFDYHALICISLRVLQSEESRCSGWHNQRFISAAWLDCQQLRAYSRWERALCMSRSDMRSNIIIFRFRIGANRPIVGSTCYSFSGYHESIRSICGQVSKASQPQGQSVYTQMFFLRCQTMHGHT